MPSHLVVHEQAVVQFKGVMGGVVHQAEQRLVPSSVNGVPFTPISPSTRPTARIAGNVRRITSALYRNCLMRSQASKPSHCLLPHTISGGCTTAGEVAMCA